MGDVIRGKVGAPASKAVAKPKINIATPSHADQFCGEYVTSLYALLTLGGRQGLSFSFSRLSYSDIVVSRNAMLSNWYFNKTDCQHILFLDDDMGFEPQLIFEMLALNKPVVGTLYPKRSIDLKALHAAGDLPFEAAVAKASSFVGQVAKPPERIGGFQRMEWCGTGVFLISRKTIDAMVEKMPDLLVPNRLPVLDDKVTTLVRAFDKITEDGREYSEDASFCKRWGQCGGEVWAATHRPVRHVGRTTFESKFADLD
jgi:hypothetical protein